MDCYILVKTPAGQAGWDDQIFHGPTEVVKRAVEAAKNAEEVEVGRDVWTAGFDGPAQALAALFSYAPGDTQVQSAPAEVQAMLDAGIPRRD